MWHGEKIHGSGSKNWHNHCDFCGKITGCCTGHNTIFLTKELDYCTDCKEKVFKLLEPAFILPIEK